MKSIRWSSASTFAALALASTVARADIDAGGDASGADAREASAAHSDARVAVDVRIPVVRQPPMCSDAITSATVPVSFTRSGPVDFGPGLIGMIGSHGTIGLDYNLLFSGMYSTGMAGHLDVNWPTALTVTAVGDPGRGYLDVTYGLHMMATLYVLNQPFPLPLMIIIDDHTSQMRSMFTPWAFNYEGTEVRLDASAYRTIFGFDIPIPVAGADISLDIQVRFNLRASVRTIEIGFPDRNDPTSQDAVFGTITGTTPAALLPAPRDGDLFLLTRWKPQIKYEGSLEFRLYPHCRNPLDLVCRLATGLLSTILRPIETGPIATSHDNLADPFDQMPEVLLPVQRIESTEIDFGDVLVDDTAMQAIHIENPGRATLAAATTTADDAAFTVGYGQCVMAGASVDVPVSFHPTHPGPFHGTATVDSNGILGTPMRIAFYGNGVTTPPVIPGRDASTHVTHLPDGATVVVADDGGNTGIQFFGPQVDGTCACRAVGAGHGTHSRNGSLAFGALALATLAHTRRRVRSHAR